MLSPIRVKVALDFICPWCYIGVAGLESVQQAWKDKYALHVTFEPYVLNDAIPKDSKGLSYSELLAAKGMSEEEVETELTRLKNQSGREFRSSVMYQMAEDVGIFLQKSNPEKRVVFTGKAQVLAQLATESLSNEKARAFVLSIFHAFHIEQENVADSDVLLRLAAVAGLDRDTVVSCLEDENIMKDFLLQAEANKEREVGVPQFRFTDADGKEIGHLSGAQDGRVLLKTFKEVASKSS
mmetsp:Transcript_16727/g.29611  ORF Transcript_16727/g.29611 Transcript_16727/m.29611 type:complete len:239 (-) Transcript_16727:109-825(-)